MSNPTRDEIAKLISANRDTLFPNLREFWHRQVGDLIAGGLPRADVAESIFTVAVVAKLAAEGAEETIKILREVADLHEKYLDDPAPNEPSEIRH